MKRVCVYCGSSPGRQDEYATVAKALGRLLADSGIGLVYGGANKGTMGVIADAALNAGGTVTGVIPKALQDKEIAHEKLTQLHVVESMHERKSLMAVLSDGFIALPGGFGTLEEIVEMLTWGQLQFHSKPCGVLNVNGYFDSLLNYFEHACSEGFLKNEHYEMLLVESDPQRLLNKFSNYEVPIVRKWVE